VSDPHTSTVMASGVGDQDDAFMLSLVVPSYNEEQNLPILHSRVAAALDGVGIAWEMVVVDDHSRDQTFKVAQQLSSRDARVRGIRLARNSGSHLAGLCGLLHAQGACAVLIAADLQDPPELIPDLVLPWRAGYHVVWAVRTRRDALRASDRAFSTFYNRMMARILHRPDIAGGGADFFLIDRRVIETLRGFRESNLSLFAILQWMGFKQTTVAYEKQAREHGTSGWTLRKKIKLAIDSITSFSYFPIRAMSWFGICIAFVGFIYAIWVIVNALIGKPAEGWTSLMVITLLLGGTQMTMLGILGEYLWRSLDEARGRPRFLIEGTIGLSFDHDAAIDTYPAGSALRRLR
jgi:polyisoprenyl-phosphate glycosyltransferase